MDDTTIETELDNLKDGESLVVVTPINGGYFLGIGTKTVSNNWAITQAELDQLADLTAKYRTNNFANEIGLEV